MPYKDPKIRRLYHQAWWGRSENAGKRQAYLRAWYLRHRDRILSAQQAIRLDALQHYSRAKVPCCRCCGETELAFLTLDHIANDGAAHRRATRATNLSALLKRQGWPKGFRVLCCNCNFGRARNGGVCPHSLLRKTERGG